MMKDCTIKPLYGSTAQKYPSVSFWEFWELLFFEALVADIQASQKHRLFYKGKHQYALNVF